MRVHSKKGNCKSPPSQKRAQYRSEIICHPSTGKERKKIEHELFDLTLIQIMNNRLCNHTVACIGGSAVAIGFHLLLAGADSP